jgi:hypothetical protein
MPDRDNASHSVKRTPFSGLIFGLWISFLIWGLVAGVILLEVG